VTALRRAVTLPVAIVAEVVLLTAAPALLVVAVVLAALTRSTRTIRASAVLLAWLAVELRTLPRLLRGRYDPDALVQEVLGAAYGLVRTVLDVRMELEDGSVPRGALDGGRPVVVLARHCGPGDSVFIAWLLTGYYGLRLHVVLKSLLRLEPAVDLAGERLPLCFVGHRGARDRAGIAALAAGMGGGDALLVFPEGGNFSWTRWRRVVAALRRGGSVRAARRAVTHRHTLPPRTGGAAAALAGAPDADVLLVVHGGFSDDGRDRRWWRLPVHRRLTVRTTLCPGRTVPRDRAAFEAWLDELWDGVDAWVRRHAVRAAAAPGR
jgi:1-acyl-sn-glycerol-3-phosphate acyltransferase